MSSAKLLALLLSVVVFAGCSSIMGQSRMEYQEDRGVTVGQKFRAPGLYDFSFPFDHYYVSRTPHSLAFLPMDAWQFVQGAYVVKVFPKGSLAKVYQNDLKKLFDLMARNEVGSKTFRQALALKDDTREAMGETAYFKYFFVPEKIYHNFDGDLIKAPARGYAGVVFMHNNYVYWLIHNEPIDEVVLEEKKIVPQYGRNTAENLQKFINGFSFGSSK
jgi:hypothetical protein